jgi:aminomethyltransferase
MEWANVPARIEGKPTRMTDQDENPQTLPLDAWHRARGARMVPFAGYSMPVQYEGIMAEHQWTRSSAGLFDVSHMGQLNLRGPEVKAALEELVPGDLEVLKPGKIRYSLLLTDDGGTIDDLMITDAGDHLYLVVNGATKHGDIAHLRQRLPGGIELRHLEDAALLALQGPKAADALGGLDITPAAPVPAVTGLSFMEAGPYLWNGVSLGISRSGYTGEDGFEISVPAAHASALADALVADERVKPIGLGARDSLRLEAGLPLYGHDLDIRTTPIMADLGFAIGKRRRAEGGFPGAERILAEIENGAAQKRVGIDVEGRQPVREGALILDPEGSEIGRITSGGHSPTLGRPIAMGYVATPFAQAGTALTIEQRGKLFQAAVAPLPFVPHRYHRKPAGA